MMTINLYKGSKVDGLTRLGKWSSLNEQTTYFDSLNKYSENVQTRRLGEPIRVNQTIAELTRYNYGSIEYGDGMRYYFRITNIAMNSEAQTDIYYEIDAYETLVKQRPFSWGRAVIHRHPNKIGKCLSPYTPTFRNLIDNESANYDYATLFYIRRDDTNADFTKYGMICTHDNIAKFFDGTWFDFYHVTGTVSQIVIASVMPGRTSQMIIHMQADTVYEFDDANYGPIPLEEVGLNYTALINDGLTLTVIKDQRGLDVFIPEEGASYEPSQVIIGASASTFKLIVYLRSTTNESKYITIPLENVMMFSDQWQEYNYRQRQIDIDTRNLKINTDLASGLISAVPNAIMGAIGGGIGKAVGGATSAKQAGAGMGAGSIFGSLANYAVSAVTSPMEQALTDRTYKNANDSLTMVGDYCLAEFNSRRMGVYVYSTDVSENYDSAIETGGYYTEIEVEDFSEYFVNGPITADVEIIGVGVEAWKEQIKARFSAGIKAV